jgi:hypothetical protein
MVDVGWTCDSPWEDIESHRLKSGNRSIGAKRATPYWMNEADRGHHFGALSGKVGGKGAENDRI